VREREQERKKNLCEEKEEEKVAGRWLAVLAAGREKVGIKEEKEKAKEMVGGIVYVMEGQRAAFPSQPSVPFLGSVWLGEMAEHPRRDLI
jgi:hypothetical protein